MPSGAGRAPPSPRWPSGGVWSSSESLSLVRSEDGEDRITGLGPSHGGSAPGLVDIDGGHEDGADGDALPERLDADDDEAGLQDRGDEQAHHGAEDRALTAEDRRAADDHRGDHVEVRQ